MSFVVVDTDVISFAFKGDTRIQLYDSTLAGNTLIASFMTLAELRLWGICKSWGQPRTQRLLDFLSNKFAVYPATLELVLGCSRHWDEPEWKARFKSFTSLRFDRPVRWIRSFDGNQLRILWMTKLNLASMQCNRRFSFARSVA